MKVTFQIEDANPVTIECNAGDNLLELARRANVAIDAPCSGNGSCGKCRVKLVEGRLESVKSRHISDEEYEAGWRLSCSSKVAGDCVVFVPDIASAYQSRMKTADLSSPKEIAIFEDCQTKLKNSGIHFTNPYRSVVLEMAEPTLDDTMPDNERLTWALREAFFIASPLQSETAKASILRPTARKTNAPIPICSVPPIRTKTYAHTVHSKAENADQVTSTGRKNGNLAGS